MCACIVRTTLFCCLCRMCSHSRGSHWRKWHYGGSTWEVRAYHRCLTQTICRMFGGRVAVFGHWFSLYHTVLMWASAIALVLFYSTTRQYFWMCMSVHTAIPLVCLLTQHPAPPIDSLVNPLVTCQRLTSFELTWSALSLQSLLAVVERLHNLRALSLVGVILSNELVRNEFQLHKYFIVIYKEMAVHVW